MRANDRRAIMARFLADRSPAGKGGAARHKPSGWPRGCRPAGEPTHRWGVEFPRTADVTPRKSRCPRGHPCATLSGVPAPIQEAAVEFLRAQRERRHALTINDPKPVENVDDIWAGAAEMATIGIFILLLGACFYFGRPLLLPILAAVVIGMTFAPLIKFGARHGVSPWLTAVVLVLLVTAVVGLLATAIAAPLTEWIARAPEIGANIKQKLYVLDRPLSALRELQETL